MGRNTLELARDSLFIEKINSEFKAADADLPTEVYSFSKERTYGFGSVPFEAAGLLIDQDADAITVAGVQLTSLLWQGLVKPHEIHKHFGQKIATAFSDLNVSPVLRVDTEHHRRIDYLYPFGVSG